MIVDCWSERLVSITGVKNLEGIEGAATFKSPGFTAAARSLGDWLLEGELMMGPDTLCALSKQEVLASYLPGPTDFDISSSLFFEPASETYCCVLWLMWPLSLTR